MSERHKKASLAGALVVLITGMLVIAITLSHPSGVPTASAQQAPPPGPLDGHDVSRLLSRLGCTADGLAAVGFNANSLAALFATAGQWLDTDTNAADLADTDAQLIAARRAEAKLVKRIRRGETTAEVRQELPILRDSIATLESSQASLRASAFESVAGLFTLDQQRLLARIASNQGQGLPAEYLVVDRTPNQWRTLREALDMERIYPEWGEEVPLEYRVELTNVRNESDVQSARALASATRAVIKSSYESAIDAYGAP